LVSAPNASDDAHLCYKNFLQLNLEVVDE